MENEEYMEMVKKQWEAMGVDPKQMIQYMNNAMEMQKNITSQFTNGQVNPFMNMMNDATNLEQNDDLNILDESPEVKPDSDLNETEQRAIACCANLSYYSSSYINTLSTYQPINEILAGLEEQWEINNKADLISTIEWLATSGHKVYFDMIWQKFKSLPKAEWRSAIEGLQLTAMTMEDIDSERFQGYAENILDGYALLLQNKSIKKNVFPNVLAWDLERAIFLCRLGYDVKFFTREEALEYIVRFSDMLKKTYTSWKEMSNGYLIGLAMWNSDEDFLTERIEQTEILLTHEKSLWVTIKW
jgi:hypothetical protein